MWYTCITEKQQHQFVTLIIHHFSISRKGERSKILERKNADIRRAAASAGVKLWQIAEGLGVNDGNFSRRLRRELSADEKEKIFQIIDNFKEQEQAHE